MTTETKKIIYNASDLMYCQRLASELRKVNMSIREVLAFGTPPHKTMMLPALEPVPYLSILLDGDEGDIIRTMTGDEQFARIEAKLAAITPDTPWASVGGNQDDSPYLSLANTIAASMSNIDGYLKNATKALDAVISARSE